MKMSANVLKSRFTHSSTNRSVVKVRLHVVWSKTILPTDIWSTYVQFKIRLVDQSTLHQMTDIAVSANCLMGKYRSAKSLLAKRFSTKIDISYHLRSLLLCAATLHAPHLPVQIPLDE